ncbi:unnamed protein product [Prunus armeniaca]|uniref:Uncharacterized protein n=1 Tax=Prunus armeniaca TaxID=36596 RepID=A0A6J5Y670_PRUAR|nr:unnamed protein product [Prunus armeniaca]
MAGSVLLQSLCCIIPHSPRCYKNQTLAFSHSQFFSSNSFLRLKKQSLVSALQINKRQRTRRYRSVPVVFAAQSNFLKGFCAKINRKGFCDSSCIGSFTLCTQVFTVYSFLCAGYEGPEGGGGTTSTPKEEGMEDSLEEGF